MKKFMFALLAITFAITGCSGLQFGGDNDVATQVLISIATRNIACEVQKMGDPAIVRTIENLYTSLKTGTVSEDALSQLSELTTSRPTLAADIVDLIALLGVQFDVESSKVLDIGEITPELFAAIEKAWGQGIVMCK